MKKVTFVHTVPSLIGLFDDLCREILRREVEVVHIADEILLKIVLEQGGLSPFIYRRVVEHAAAAEQAGADLVQLTCSSISPCAQAARKMVTIPVLKIDEPMVDRALDLGERVGVAATAATTLKPTTDLVYERAKAVGKNVSVESVLCEGAYSALFSGDTETHDRIVRDCIHKLSANNQVVLLAQASMARVIAVNYETEKEVPILTSPRLAIERISDLFR